MAAAPGRAREAREPLTVSLPEEEDARITGSLCRPVDAENAWMEWREIAVERTSGE